MGAIQTTRVRRIPSHANEVIQRGSEVCGDGLWGLQAGVTQGDGKKTQAESTPYTGSNPHKNSD